MKTHRTQRRKHSQSSWREGLPYGALPVLVLVAYLPAFSGGFVWDDDYHVTNNSTLLSLDGLRRIWLEPGAVPQYYPLVHTSFWVEHHLWGNDPRGYHAVNVLLHCAATLFLWRVLVRLRVPGAWLGAALFAVHPVEVESVAWIAERKNLLAAVFGLASLLAYLRFSPLESDAESSKSAEAAPPERRSPQGSAAWRYYAVSLAFFVAALLSKTVIAVLPAVLLVITWWKRGKLTRRDLALVAPFFAVALPLALQTVWLEKHHVGATGEAWALSLLERVLIAGRALWFYVGKLVWPANLTFFYSRWTIDASVWWQYLFPLAAAATMIALWLLRGRLGRGPPAAALIFAGVLLPALGFFDVYPMRYSFVADHFQYHASMALLALAGAGGAALLARLSWRDQWVGNVAAASVLAILVGLTFWQAGLYATAEALYRDSIAKNPQSWIAHNNLGVYLRDHARYDEAIPQWQEAVSLAANEPELRNNLGGGLIWQGRMAEAAEQLRAAVEILPNYAGAHSNLGIALFELQQLDEAIGHFEQALAVVPDFPNAHNGLAKCLAAQGRLDAAQAHLDEALRLNPRYADAHHQAGILYWRRGQTSEAATHFAEAVRLQPSFPEARYNYAVSLHAQGRIDDAGTQLVEALRQTPDYAEAHNLMGRILEERGHLDEAIAAFSTALRLRPDHADAVANLKQAMARKQQGTRTPLKRPLRAGGDRD